MIAPEAAVRWLALAMAVLAAPAGHGLRPAPFATHQFGLSLNTGLNNQLFTLFVVKEFEGRVIQVESISRDQFMLQAQGVVPSKANPRAENLFRKFEVAACLPDTPDTARVHLLDCGIFDELWKLRFQDYPFRLVEGQHPGKGWAERPAGPSPRQLLLLTEYGMLHLSDMARGENVFGLLRDVGDSMWVDNYLKGY